MRIGQIESVLPLNIVLRTGRKRLRERAWKILKDAPTQLGPVVSFCEIIISQEGLGKAGIVLKPFNVMLRTDRMGCDGNVSIWLKVKRT